MEILKKELCDLLGMVADSMFDEQELLNMKLSDNIDSITFIKFVVAIEEKYNIEFDDDMLDITNIGVMEELAEYVRRKGNTDGKC